MSRFIKQNAFLVIVSALAFFCAGEIFADAPFSINKLKIKKLTKKSAVIVCKTSVPAQGRAHYGTDAGGPQMSFGAFSPPAKNQQLDHQSLQQDQSISSEGVGGSGQQEHQRSRSSDSPDAEMTQLQQQFKQLGQPSAAPPQQYPGPHRGWMGGQSPNIFGQSPVPPGAGLFGGAGASFMEDPRQAGMSPMNIPPLPSGIMVS